MLSLLLLLDLFNGELFPEKYLAGTEIQGVQFSSVQFSPLTDWVVRET